MAPEKKRSISSVVVASALVLAAFFGGLYVGGKNYIEAQTILDFVGLSAKPPENVDLTPVWKAWHLLEEKYVPASSTAPLTDEQKVWGMIEGLAKAYNDPYTVFLPPEDSALFAEDISGEFNGVGMEIGMRDDLLTVIAPLKDTPAEKAGIRAGDKIIEIDGESTQDMSVDEAVKTIRGEAGAPVTLTVAREGETEFIDIEIVRAEIKIPTIATELRPDGIFVIELYNFGATAPSDFRDALREFMASGSNKLIFDLRGNPGGYLEVAVDIASWFLPSGKVIVQEDFGGDEERRAYRSKGYNVFESDWEVVVLTNEGSASASEIVAGALSEHGVATLVGETTFGKGSVQELVDVTGETSLKVTVARWLTPNGTSISDGGLKPDIEVPLTIEDFEAERDPQLDRAVQFLLNGE